MIKRIITGAIVSSAVCLVLYFSYIPAVILVAAALLDAFCLYEIYNAAGILENEALFTLSLTAASLTVFLEIPYYTQIITVVFALAVVTFLVLMLLYRYINFKLPIIAFYVAALIVMMISSVPELRRLDNGIYYLSGAIIICFTTDIAAYLFGGTFGKHKIFPIISPNKTIEGSVAGIVFGALAVVIIAMCMDAADALEFDYVRLCIYAVLASVAGEFGDLAMSCVKRICRVKDFGNILPGHGGILDRFDSFVLASAFTLIYCNMAGGFII